MQSKVEDMTQPLVFETGLLAKQADGSVVVSQGDSVVLVTVAISQSQDEEKDFLPLMVEYQEMSYAAGRIPGGFIKREGRASEQEILIARFIDRPLRPLIQKGFYRDIQIIASVLSADPDHSPDVLAINGASAALHMSSVPFDGPVGGVRIGRIDGELVINPSVAQLENSTMELVVVGTRDAVVMVEGEAKELPEEEIIKAIAFAHTKIAKIIDAQEELRKAGKEKIVVKTPEEDTALQEAMKGYVVPRLEAIIDQRYPKQERHLKIDALEKEAIAACIGEEESKIRVASEYFSSLEKKTMRKMVSEKGIRIDGRGLSDIRPIDCKVGLLPRTHGSALFTRGETQSLAITTLGSSSDEQRLESLLGETSKSFMLHYYFPPFCVGEVKPLRGPSRREIGHGNLAERALVAVLPDGESFPYTIRLVSEILESNGSSSMATVCSGSLSLMDAGVPIKKPVAGIAMGLVKEGDKYVVLSDILGDEDALGDMDFKVAGTTDGVTALQMDIKIAGIPEEVLSEALRRAKEGRLFILGKMNTGLTQPRQNISKYAPRIYTITVNTEKIRDIIGPGGKVIRDIIARTGTKIDINDSGKVDIFSPDEDHANMAIDMINALTEEAQIGKIYVGKVAKITTYGAFVDILPGVSGLVHISQLAEERVKEVTDVVKEGEEILVKVIDIDKQGKIKLSRKEALNKAKPQE
jgi:polyribonucleotide nucleotidyltransferase